MRVTPLFIGLSLALAAQASWFGSDSDSTSTSVKPYTSWSSTELRDWLDAHSITVPKKKTSESDLRALVESNWDSATTWTYDQYAAAQKSFADLRASSFDAWDESRLREWLLEQGVVAPKGPKEKLALLAKEKYRQYTSAASSFSRSASETASKMAYDDKMDQASKTVESLKEKATAPVVAAFDETRDYIYSTWDENQMRSWLESKGLLKTKQQKKKDELLQMMHDAWGKVADPVWSVWSDSYMHNWLVSHNIIKSEPQRTRDHYVEMMKTYFYAPSDFVWNSWSDSQLKNWLIANNVIKSDAQVGREKMLNLVRDNYISAKDTFWDAWSDNQIKDWLVEHGYMRSDAQYKRDELIKAANEKYKDYNARTAAYLTWPDARLRAYLREQGLSEDLVPGGRPGLLQEVRIRWIQTEHNAETILGKVREMLGESSEKVEDVLSRMLYLVSNGWVDLKGRAAEDVGAVKEGYADVKSRTEQELRDAKKVGERQYDSARKVSEEGYEHAKGRAAGAGSWAGEKAQDARENVGEKVKRAGSSIKGEL